MSTTFYTLKKFTSDEKTKLHSAVDGNDIITVTNICNDHEKEEIGHRAGGWMFSWNPFHSCLKSISKQSIIDLVYNDDIIIIDEYNTVLDKDEFLDMSFNWCPDGLTSNTYRDKYPEESYSYIVAYYYQRDGIKICKERYDFDLKSLITNDYQTDFIYDGLRWTLLTL